MILGIVGLKGHGKDAFAKAVRKLDPSYTVRHFASPLKKICKEVFQLTDLELHSPEVKDAKFRDGPMEVDSYLEYLESEVGFHIEPTGFIAHTPRALLQHVGTDLIRSRRPRFWLDAFLQSLGTGERRLTNVLVPDTRFANEVGLIRSMNGKIIRVVRTDAPVPTDTHASELYVHEVDPDYEVRAATGDFATLERAAAEVLLSSLLVDGGTCH